MQTDAQKAKMLFHTFSLNGVLDKYDLPLFYKHCTDALADKPTEGQRREIVAMMETVSLSQGIPGQTYGKRPGYNGETLLRNSPRTGSPIRDGNGRWCCDPDMLEGDLPVVIDWQAVEDLDWDLLTEYREAYKVALVCIPNDSI